MKFTFLPIMLTIIASNTSFAQLAKTNASNLTTVKIYYDNNNEKAKPFVKRQVPKTTPLKSSIQQYLAGVNPREAKQGYKTNNLGIHQFDVIVKNKTAYIHFRTDDLRVDNPQQVVDFTTNISQIAEQFPTVKDTEICINGIENYQMTFFANESEVRCKF